MSWFYYLGMKFGMSGTDVELATYGEMLDLITCHYIYTGALVPKKKVPSFDEIMALE